MKNLLIVLGVVLLVACQVDKKNESAHSYQFYLGTYTDGNAEGIYKCTMTSEGLVEGIKLMVKSNNPSFLAFDADKKHLLAVNEVDENGVGSVESYVINNDSLVLINRSSSGGAHPCHISVNEDGIIAVSNYTGGNIGWLKLGQNGRLSDLWNLSEHNNPVDTSLVAHAHSAWFLEGKQEVMAVDLGTNELWHYSYSNEKDFLVIDLSNKYKIENGAGPRHMAQHDNPEWLYVINELDNTVTHVYPDEKGKWKVGTSVTTLPANFDGKSYCADIHISNDGRFLYGSNRGHNSIVIYSIEEDGSLSLLAHESVRGDHPRNFSLTPDGKFLLVANKNTNNIVSFKRDAKTGLLQFVGEVKMASPVCILFE